MKPKLEPLNLSYPPNPHFTEAELRNAFELICALNDYYEVGHLVEINADVLINRICSRVFGDNVWIEMVKEMRSREMVSKSGFTSEKGKSCTNA